MTDGELLYDAILDSPNEDTPKAMYADWLVENDGTQSCPACRGGLWCPKCSGEGCSVYGGICLTDYCDTCKNERKVPNGYRVRAEFIRLQMADPKLNVNPWTGYFKIWFAPLLEGHGTYVFNERGVGEIEFPNDDLVVVVRNGFVSEVQSNRGWFTDRHNAARLFTQPIAKVVIADPGYLGFTHPAMTTVRVGMESHYPASLRRALGEDPRLERLYDTRAEADQALSDVCVDFGRRCHTSLLRRTSAQVVPMSFAGAVEPE